MTILERLSVLFEHHLACPDWGMRDGGIVGPCRKEDCSVCSSDGLLIDIRDALTRLELWPETVRWVREHYPEDVFPLDSQTPDARAARMGRLTCDNIVREYEERLAALAREETPHK